MKLRPEPPEGAAAAGTSGVREAVQRWRLVLARDPLPAPPGQRESLGAWEEALVATGLAIAGLDAPRPRPRFVIAAPLAATVQGDAELADLWLVERLPRWLVRERLTPHLPAGHALVDLYDVWLGEPALPGQVVASVYRASLRPPTDPAALAAAANALLLADSLPRARRKGDATVAYDLRPFLGALEVLPSPSGGAVVRMTLRHDPARGLGRPEEALAALDEAVRGPAAAGEGQAGPGFSVDGPLVRERLVLAEATPADPAPPKAARRPSMARPARVGAENGPRTGRR